MKSRMQISRVCCQNYFLNYTDTFLYSADGVAFGDLGLHTFYFSSLQSFFNTTTSIDSGRRNDLNGKSIFAYTDSEIANNPSLLPAQIDKLATSNILITVASGADFSTSYTFITNHYINYLRQWLENGGRMVWFVDRYIGRYTNAYQNLNNLFSLLGSTLEFEEISTGLLTNSSFGGSQYTNIWQGDSLNLVGSAPIIDDWTSESDIDFDRWGRLFTNISIASSFLGLSFGGSWPLVNYYLDHMCYTISGGTPLISQDFTVTSADNEFKTTISYEENFTQTICSIERVGNGCILLLPIDCPRTRGSTSCPVDGVGTRRFSSELMDRMLTRSVDELIV